MMSTRFRHSIDTSMNLFNYTVPAAGETFETLLSHKNVEIIRIVSSDRLEEKVYCQDEDEWVVVLEGEALLSLDGEEKRLKRGDSLFIPAKTQHRVLETKRGTLWLAIHIKGVSKDQPVSA